MVRKMLRSFQGQEKKHDENIVKINKTMVSFSFWLNFIKITLLTIMFEKFTKNKYLKSKKF